MMTYRLGNAVGMEEFYPKNGKLLPPNGDFVIGKRGIQAVRQSVMEMGIREAKLVTIDLENQKDAAIEIGEYKLSAEDGHTTDLGKFITIWKNEAGQWKLHRDIWSSDQ